VLNVTILRSRSLALASACPALGRSAGSADHQSGSASSAALSVTSNVALRHTGRGARSVKAAASRMSAPAATKGRKWLRKSAAGQIGASSPARVGAATASNTVSQSARVFIGQPPGSLLRSESSTERNGVDPV
jgi:hypothetical protein